MSSDLVVGDIVLRRTLMRIERQADSDVMDLPMLGVPLYHIQSWAAFSTPVNRGIREICRRNAVQTKTWEM